MKVMLDNFLQILPEVIFEAAETLGGRCTGRFYALHALENRVYDIEMDEGPHVVIKFYRPGRWSRAAIQAEHDFLQALAESEIPVVCPLADGSGHTIFAINQVMFTIFPKRPGRLEPEPTAEQLTRLGRFLARLHSVGAAVKAAPRLRLDPQTYARDPLKFLKDGKFVPMELASRFETIVTQICDAITPRFEDVKYVLLHGDCHSGNILWNRDDPYIIDFDDMLYAPAVQDIWMLAGGDDDYGKERRRILLEAYEEFRAFDMTTLRLIEPLRALRMIHFSAWIARRWEDSAFKAAFPDFGTEHYWQEQIEDLALQLEKVQYATTDLYR
jgi:Ser/Thr protein kinase RdoA (MazF antagonist)